MTNNNSDTILNLKNAEGHIKLNKTYLEYCEKIIEAIKKHPEYLSRILIQLEITEKDFWNIINGTVTANITFYDTVYSYTKTLNLYKEKDPRN